ncbi:MAG TPA: O-antigen ligase family protein [Solirubrobacterales bacterium]
MRAPPEAPCDASGGEAGASAPTRFQPAALLPLLVLTIVFSWWGAKAGGFFGTVLLPGTVALCAALAMLTWIAPWPARLRASRAVSVALGAAITLGCWAALSAVWSPAPDIAIADGQRILAYAVAFGLGLWLSILVGRRRHLALVPLALAGAFGGAIAAIGMHGGDHPGNYLEPDGTLEYPLGYRNANAAFFLIAFWPALGLAARRESPWPGRGLALAAATLCLSMGMLSQSRGSMIAGAAALCVYVAFSRERARRLAWLALAVLPALLVLPALTDLYQAASAGTPMRDLGGELRRAGNAAILATGVALALGAVAALAEARLPTSARVGRIADRAAIGAVVAVVLGGSMAFVAVVGDPLDWVGQKASEFQAGESSRPVGKESRFTLNARTGRGELWRIALLDFRRHPLLGDGGGGYRYTYLRERRPDAPPAVHDAHSVELENLSELGVVGLVLFASAVAAAAAGALRARRFGTGAAWVSAFALTAGTYWLFHSSLDWFWPYPAITAPVFALFGSACAPAVAAESSRQGRGSGRLLVAGAAIVLAISTVPPFLSERYVNDAYDVWRADPGRAYDDLDRAESLNPLSVDPLLAEGAIAKANGDRSRAVQAFQDAIAKRPEEWVSYYLLAVLHRHDDPALARRELEAAHARDPQNGEIDALADELRSRSSGGQ